MGEDGVQLQPLVTPVCGELVQRLQLYSFFTTTLCVGDDGVQLQPLETPVCGELVQRLQLY